MMKFFGFLFFVAVAVGVWGWWTGRFVFSKSEANGKTSIGVTIDNDAITRDLDAMTQWGREKLDQLDQKIDELRKKASKASAESKRALQEEIDQLEQQKDAAAESLKSLKDGAQAQAAELKARLERTLKDATEAVEKSDD